MKDLVLGRGLSEREGKMLARDRDAWGGMVYIYIRVEGRCEDITFRFRKRHPPSPYVGDRVARDISIYI